MAVKLKRKQLLSLQSPVFIGLDDDGDGDDDTDDYFSFNLNYVF